MTNASQGKEIEKMSIPELEDILGTKFIPEQDLLEYNLTKLPGNVFDKFPEDAFRKYAVFKDRKQRLYFFEEIKKPQEYFQDESIAEETETTPEQNPLPQYANEYKLLFIIPEKNTQKA